MKVKRKIENEVKQLLPDVPFEVKSIKNIVGDVAFEIILYNPAQAFFHPDEPIDIIKDRLIDALHGNMTVCRKRLFSAITGGGK